MLVITLSFALERFSIETKTSYPINQSDLEANTSNRRQARENAYDQVAIGFGFTSDRST